VPAVVVAGSIAMGTLAVSAAIIITITTIINSNNN
jgi:hypothetical protein